MPTPTFTTPPDAPTRAQPSTFVARADAFIAWFATFKGELVTGVAWIVDQVDSIATSVSTAAGSATAAAGSATAAATARDVAEDHRDAAQGFASSALSAPGTSATSSTGRSLTTGSKDFTLDQTGKLFAVGQTVVVTRTSDPTKRMTGPITAFAADVLTVDVQLLSSTGGPYTDWTIALSALPFATVASQAQAEAGADNDKSMTPLRTAQAIAALSPSVSVAIIQDQKSANTTGQTFTPNIWNTRNLNTEAADPDGIVTIASNQFTLDAGTYLIFCEGGFYPSSNVSAVARSRIYNSTDAAVVAQGPNSQATYGATDGSFEMAFVPAVGIVTIASAKAFEYQTLVPNVSSTQTGVARNFSGTVEVYSTITIMKLA